MDPRSSIRDARVGAHLREQAAGLSDGSPVRARLEQLADQAERRARRQWVAGRRPPPRLSYPLLVAAILVVALVVFLVAGALVFGEAPHLGY
jgi:hypothetical protein